MSMPGCWHVALAAKPGLGLALMGAMLVARQYRNLVPLSDREDLKPAVLPDHGAGDQLGLASPYRAIRHASIEGKRGPLHCHAEAGTPASVRRPRITAGKSGGTRASTGNLTLRVRPSNAHKGRAPNVPLAIPAAFWSGSRRRCVTSELGRVIRQARVWSRTCFARGLAWFSINRATLVVAVLTLVATVYFGFYPRQPGAPVLDPDSIYRGGKIVGRVMGFSVPPVLTGQFAFLILPSATVSMGDVLQFRTATCFVAEVRPDPPTVLVRCRVIGT